MESMPSNLTDDSTGPAQASANRLDNERVLAHIDRFEELLANGDLKEAANVAAASQRGVLRSMQTLAKFKRLDADAFSREFTSENVGFQILFHKKTKKLAKIFFS